MRLAILLIALFVAGCSRAPVTYRVIHRDGRVWLLDGPPSGYGLNGVIQNGLAGTYSFRGDDGFVITVRQSDCKVTEI